MGTNDPTVERLRKKGYDYRQIERALHSRRREDRTSYTPLLESYLDEEQSNGQVEEQSGLEISIDKVGKNLESLYDPQRRKKLNSEFGTFLVMSGIKRELEKITNIYGNEELSENDYKRIYDMATSILGTIGSHPNTLRIFAIQEVKGFFEKITDQSMIHMDYKIGIKRDKVSTEYFNKRWRYEELLSMEIKNNRIAQKQIGKIKRSPEEKLRQEALDIVRSAYDQNPKHLKANFEPMVRKAMAKYKRLYDTKAVNILLEEIRKVKEYKKGVMPKIPAMFNPLLH